MNTGCIVKNNGIIEVIIKLVTFDKMYFIVEYGRLRKKSEKDIDMDEQRGYAKLID